MPGLHQADERTICLTDYFPAAIIMGVNCFDHKTIGCKTGIQVAIGIKTGQYNICGIIQVCSCAIRSEATCNQLAIGLQNQCQSNVFCGSTDEVNQDAVSIETGIQAAI